MRDSQPTGEQGWARYCLCHPQQTAATGTETDQRTMWQLAAGQQFQESRSSKFIIIKCSTVSAMNAAAATLVWLLSLQTITLSTILQAAVSSARDLEAAAGQSQGSHNIALPQSVGTRFKAAYHYVVCEADYLVEPDNTQDVAYAVKAYRQLAESQGAALKIRASRR